MQQRHYSDINSTEDDEQQSDLVEHMLILTSSLNIWVKTASNPDLTIP